MTASSLPWADDIAAPVVKDDGATYQMLDLLSDRYASTRLVKSGTLASTLVDADWMDQTYLTGQITAPKGVKVEITDPDGSSYVIPVEGPTLGEDRPGKQAGCTKCHCQWTELRRGGRESL